MKHTHDEHSEQLTLFQVAPTNLIKTIHDPYWDEVEEIAHQHSKQKVESETQQVTTPCNFVGEQVNNDTQKPAHQHDTHWIERYWVERGANKYWYYRYAWMDGRKIRRIYIGSVSSALAQHRKSEIELAINDGQSPQEIWRLIRQQRCV